ncbi:hypothetical protein RRSWK_00121 [Rhodopirellula sp. SWK7]|nr:hypothetical protein RRSWK_00121 [Rhodopirellula sp. SWK7]
MSREHQKKVYPICKSGVCGFFNADASGEFGCDLVPGCRCNLIKGLIDDGMGCPAEPQMFPPESTKPPEK